MLIVLIVNRATRVIIKSNAVLVSDLTVYLNDVVQSVRLCRIVLLLLVLVLHALYLFVFFLVLVVIGFETTDLLAPLLLLLLFLLAGTSLIGRSCCFVRDSHFFSAFSLLRRLVVLQ